MAEGIEIAFFAIGRAGLPAAEQDADPFEGQGSQGGVVSLAKGSLLEVQGLGPEGLLA